MSDPQPPQWPGVAPQPAPAWNPYQAAHAPADPWSSAALASRGSRLAAQLLNAGGSAVLVAVGAIPGAVMASGAESKDVGGLLALAGGALGLLIWATLNLIQLSATGQSLGKKWMSIRVVRTNGEKPSLARLVFLRFLLVRCLGVIPFFELIDALVIFSADQRCIHDHLADTRVVQA